MATMVQVICDHKIFFFNGLFHSFSEETISDDDYARNYDDIGELNKEIDRLLLIATWTTVMIKVTE